MSSKIPLTAIKAEITPIQKTAKILSWVSGTSLTISVIALTTIALLAYFSVIHNVSGLILYTPPGGLGVLSTALGILSLIIRCSYSSLQSAQVIKQTTVPKKTTPKKTIPKKKIKKTKTPSSPSPITVASSDPILPPEDVELTPLEKWKKTVEMRETLHPTVEEEEFLFKEPSLQKIDSPKKALSCFMLLMGDFMGLDTEGYPASTELSLSFLIQHLKGLEGEELVDNEKLSPLIQLFEKTHYFAAKQSQLRNAPSLVAYQNGRSALSKEMLATLKREKTLLLDAGYVGKPAGHALTVELTLEEDQVHGVILNRGEGISGFHPHDVTDKVRFRGLELKSTSLKELEHSNFLDLVTDFQMPNLISSETAYGGAKETGYSINDIYEVLLPSWPGEIADRSEHSHSKQHGGSCTLKAFLGHMKEVLGKEDGDTAKMYLGLVVFELLLSQAEVDTFDLNRLEDALAKFNRFTVKLTRASRVNETLKKKVLELSARVSTLMEQVRKEKQRVYSEHKLELEPIKDRGTYALELPKVTPIAEKLHAHEDEVKLADLPPFSKEHFSEYTKTVEELIRKAVDDKQLQHAKDLASEALLALPNPSDLFWNTAKSGFDIRRITFFAEILLKEKTRGGKELNISANEVTLYLKILTISFKQARVAKVPEEVINLYGTQANQILAAVQHLYSFTHPRYATIFFDCQSILSAFSQKGKTIKLTSVEGVDHAWTLEKKRYKSLEEVQSNLELKFLYQFLQLHPDLYHAGGFNKLGSGKGDAFNTLRLSIERSFYNPYDLYDNLTFMEKNPDWDPVRHWSCVRKLYHLFLFSSYLSGTTYSYHHAGKSEFHFEFGGRSRKNTKEVRVGQFEPKNPAALSEELLMGNFYAVSKEMKKWFDAFLKPSVEFMGRAHEHQNEQLLFQNGTKIGEELDLSSVELQQLLSIPTYDALRIPQLITFFTQNFYRLKNPSFQAIFAQLLFSLNKEKSDLVLHEVLKSSSLVKYQLFSFLQSALTKTQTLGWVESHLFLIRIYAQTIGYLLESEPEEELLRQAIEPLGTHINSLIEDPPFPEIERGKIFYTLTACAPYFNHPKATELFKLCQKAKEHAASAGGIKKVEKRALWQEDYLVGDRLLNHLEEPKGMLPKWVLSHDDYIFETNFFVREIEEGVYAFFNEGREYRLTTDGPTFRTYQKIKGRFYELKKSSLFSEGKAPSTNHPCTNGYLVTNVRIWHAVDDPKEVVVFSTEPRSHLCTIKEDGIYHPTLPLTLAVDYTHPVIERIGSLASKSEILGWKNAHDELVQVEIPSYGLTFKCEKGEEGAADKWKSEQYSGYYLDTKSICSTLEPYSHYLVLRNRKGKRVAVVPMMGVVATKQNAFEPIHARVKKLSSTVSIAMFPLDKKGNIDTLDNPEHTIYLIYLAMRKGAYKLAKKLVHQAKRERPEWESKWCIWIQDLDLDGEEVKNHLDRHPEATALRIQIRLLMKELSSEKLNAKGHQNLKRDYFAYLDQRQHTFGARLSHEEELKCLKIIEKNKVPLTDEELFQIAVRRHALDTSPLPLAKKPIEDISIKSPTSELPEAYKWISEEVTKIMVPHVATPKPIALLSRPGSAMVENFLYYYAIARHLPHDHPLKQELLELLRVTRLARDAKTRSLHYYLMQVIQNPTLFLPIDKLLANQEVLHMSLQNQVAKFVRVDWPASWSFAHAKDKLRRHHCITENSRFEPTCAVAHPFAHIDLIEVHDYPFDLKLSESGFLYEQGWKEREEEITKELTTLEEMKCFFTKCEDDNPCVTKEFTRLIEGIEDKERILTKDLHEKQPPYLLDLTRNEILKKQLQDLHKKYKKKIESKEKAILKIAHHYPETLKLEAHGRMLKPLSLNELIVHFGIGDEEAIYASNPSLTPKDLVSLKTLLTEYLILSTDHNQILALSDSLQKIASHKSTSEEFVQKACAKRVYNPLKEPHLLVFEFFGKIRLRKEQYEALLDLTGTEENLELEARTGFGKSKVLIPLWLFLKSRKEKTAMMTVPTSLFLAQYKHLKKILGKAFDSLIIPIQFNRSKADDPKYLKRLCKKLDDAKIHHKIVLTTIQSLHGMTSLKLKEALASGSGETDTKLQGHLHTLHSKIANQVADFFDESKVCFNIRHRYDYAVGALSSVDPAYFSTACSIYRNLFLETDLLNDVNVEFFPQFHAEKKLTPLQENYETQLLPLFVAKISKIFNITGFEEIVLNDLQGNYTEECEPFYDTLKPEQLEEYARLKKQLTTHLRRTVFKKCDDGYGFYPGTRLAIPFLDGTAKTGSEFSEVEDYIDFTIQANLKKPFTVREIETFIIQLQLKATEVGLDTLSLSKPYKLLQKITETPLMEIDESEYPKLVEVINTKLNLKLDFIEFAVLPNIKIYKKKIASTSFNLVRAIHHLQAASGTVNPDMLPPRLSTREDKGAVLNNLVSLWKHSKERIFILKGKTATEKLSNLLTQRIDECVLIDVAGTFRELTPSQIAETILDKRPGVKGVVLFDDEGKELVYERASKVLVPIEESLLETDERFVFIRKSKAIGTDTDMALTAEAIVTVDRDTQQDLFFQGTGRMRKIPQGQIVGYAVAQEDANIIFGSHKKLFQHLIAYVVRTQGKQKGDDAFYVLRLYLEDLIDAAFWNAAKKCGSIEELQVLFEAFEQFIVKETQSKALTSLRKKRSPLPADEAVTQLKSDLLAPIEAFIKVPENAKWAGLFDLEQIGKEFDAFVDYKKLPKTISTFAGHEGVSIVEADVMTDEAVDQTTNAELENEDLNEDVSDKVSDLPSIRYTAAKPLRWDGDYRAQMKEAPEATLLGIPIYYSPNFARVSEDISENNRVQKPAYQYVIHTDKKGAIKILLLDLYDAREVMRRMVREPRSSDKEAYYLFTGSKVIASDRAATMLHLDKDFPHALSIHLLRKLFTATPTLTHKEKEYLKLQPEKSIKTFMEFAEELNKLWPHLSDYIAGCRDALKPQED